MITFKLKLNEEVKRKIISLHINPFVHVHDIPFEIKICIVYNGCRPIFIKNQLYNDMGGLLRFISKNSGILGIYKDDERINNSDFIKHIMDLTIDSIDIDQMKDIKELNNIYQELYKDDIGSIWLNK